MSKVVGTLNTANKIKFIKSVYGKDKFDNNASVQFGNEIIVAWYIIGYETLEDLEKKYFDNEILELFEKQK
jgi:hypothetical protein